MFKEDIMKAEGNSFCVDSSCGYFRSTDTIFRDLAPEYGRLIDEHFSAKHIML